MRSPFPRVPLAVLCSLAALGCQEPSDKADTADSTGDTGSPLVETTTPAEAIDRRDCAEPTSGPTEHGSLSADEVWTADASPHVLPYDTSIYATLTLEPCATVVIGSRKTVSLFPDGRIEALGLPGQAVTIGRQDPASAWASVKGIGGTLHLEHTRVEGGGDPLNGGTDQPAAIVMMGRGVGGPDAVFHAEHVVIDGSASQGVALEAGGAFTEDSVDLRVSGSQGYPVRAWTNVLGTLPEGDYTGNGSDEILVPGNAVTDVIVEDMIIHERGVPYHIGDALGTGEMRVGLGQGGAPAVLTIEPGVQLRFKEGGLLSVEHYQGDEPATGALVAVGTEEAPIVFTSAAQEPQPGDWLGVWFGGIPDPRDQMDHTRVEFAGGTSSTGSSSCPVDDVPINDAAIRIFGVPAEPFVTHTEIVGSAGHGLDRGWRDAAQVDFLPTNTFIDIALCQQSFPGNPSAACPVDLPCPQ